MRRRTGRTSGPRTPAILLLLLVAGARCGGNRHPDDSSPSLRPPTESERSGEAVFKRENCGRCHTLFERAGGGQEPVLSSTPPGGSPTSRVGPDLGLEGHRRSDDWQLAHLYAPGALEPGSPMPASRHLFHPENGRPVPTREGIDLVAYLQRLGRGERDVWADRRSLEPAIPAPPAVDDDLGLRGEELYRRHCAPCHGEEGNGRGEAAVLLAIPPRNFVAGPFRYKSTHAGEPPKDSDLFRSITLGSGTGASMPSFDWLSPRDRWALVVRIKRFSSPARPIGLEGPFGRGAPGGPWNDVTNTGPAGERGDPAGEGRRLFEDLGCGSCHGAAATGMTREEAGADWRDATGAPVPWASDLTHACSLRGGASPEALATDILLGVEPAMPSYAADLLESEGLRNLIGYLRSLDTPGRHAAPAGEPKR